MKLSKLQSEMKQQFRLLTIDAWLSTDKFMMFNVSGAIAKNINESVAYTELRLSEIPSIRLLRWKIPASVFMARHYPLTSSALFAGKTKEQIMVIWGKEKYTCMATKKRSADDLAVMNEINKERINRRLCKELITNSVDKNQRSAWGIVK